MNTPQQTLVSDEQVDEVHRAAYPIDLHLDSFNFAMTGGFDFEKGDWKATKSKWLLWFTTTFFPKGRNAPLYYHVSGKDLTKGGYGGGCAAAHGLLENITWLPLGDPWKRWIEHKTYLCKLVADNSDKYRLTKTPQDVQEAKTSGAISLILSVEGAHLLGKLGRRTRALRRARLREWAQDGVAYVTLNHFCNTDISMGGYAPLNPLRWTKGFGLSDFGHEVVQTCIDTGILIDLTHTSTKGISGVCQLCAKQGVPVIASHGASRKITKGTSRGNPYRLRRSLDDEAIADIIRTGGCISVILAPYFLQIRRTKSGGKLKDESVAFVVDYYERLAQQIADLGLVDDPWDHLSFGSDFDGGIASIPTGMKSGADLPELTRAMLAAGWPDDRVKRVYSGNFLRVWAAAQAKTKDDQN